MFICPLQTHCLIIRLVSWENAFLKVQIWTTKWIKIKKNLSMNNWILKRNVYIVLKFFNHVKILSGTFRQSVERVQMNIFKGDLNEDSWSDLNNTCILGSTLPACFCSCKGIHVIICTHIMCADCHKIWLIINLWR